MFLFFSRRRQIAALLILGCFLTGNAFAQMSVSPASSEKGDMASSVEAPIQAEKPKRKLPTGLLELTGFNDPVYFYSPEGLEADKKYPLIVMVPGEGMPAEKLLEYILPTAKSLECFVLATSTWPRDGGAPTTLDSWLLKVKNDITLRFPIDSSKIYAFGVNAGGHYAAYLITAYPNDFSGAALVGEAWEGLFTDLLVPSSDAGKQMPVVAAFTADQKDKQIQNEKWVLEYQRKGYPVQVMNPPEGQDLNSSEFKVALLEWLDQKGQAWKLIREEKNKTFKQRFKKGVKEFFEV